MEKYLNHILESLADQIGMQQIKAIANIQIAPANTEQISAPISTNVYTQRILISEGQTPSSVITIESPLSFKDCGCFLAISCIDVLAEWLRESTQEETNIQRSDFRFISLNGIPLEAKDAAKQILNRSSVLITQQLSAWMGVEFRAIDELALRPYEGQKPSGVIAVAFSVMAEKACDWRLEKRIPFDATHTRLIRKLLAGTGKKGGLVLYKDPEADMAYVVGVCDSLTEIVREQSDLFPIWLQISNWMSWELYIYGQTVFYSQFSGYSAVPVPDVLSSIKREFGNARDYSKLQAAIGRIQKQTHGAAAMILNLRNNSLVTIHMEELAKANKAIKVSFDKLEEALTYAAGMDGACVLDLDGNVQYLAAILDGPSCVSGDLSRGSRFNSVKNFAAWISKDFQDGAVGIVCSEDGGIDVISGKEALISD